MQQLVRVIPLAEGPGSEGPGSEGPGRRLNG